MKHIKDKDIQLFQTKMLEWFEQHGREFPWRKKRMTSYQYIIAEVLLQRTKAETIAKFYPQFIKRFPSWKSLATANKRTIENFLKPIGLYRQRAARLQNLAKEMVIRKGRLPKDREELESIPFMGQYIANAVELFIHKKPAPLMDVNMAPVLENHFGKRTMADIRYDPYLQELALRVVTHERSQEINWAILDYSALILKHT